MNMDIDRTPPNAFLASEYEPAPAKNAHVHVIPVPLEKTVSYGSGTARGPSAILDASQQLEKLPTSDHRVPVRIHTTAAVDTAGAVETCLDALTQTVHDALTQAAMPILLGGEHTVTYGAAQALARRFGGKIGIVQFDAHADLRQTYQGTPWSHACIMRRILDLDMALLQVGVRSISEEERRLRSDYRLPCIDARVLCRDGIPNNVVPETFPPYVYVTFDVDAFDASVMPATGTPEPGGLDWWTAITMLEHIAQERILIGADVVELAPDPAHRHCDYTAAKLVAHIISLRPEAIPAFSE